jgi:hypothetical protein
MSLAERLVRRTGARVQFAFALEAKATLPPCARSVLAASHDGLHVLARDEAALMARLLEIRQAYAPDIEVSVPAARQDRLLLSARIGLQRRDLPSIREALLRRGANASEEYAGLHYCVLRFDAALNQLMGLPGELAALTGATASHTFQPVPDRLRKRRTDVTMNSRMLYVDETAGVRRSVKLVYPALTRRRTE